MNIRAKSCEVPDRGPGFADSTGFVALGARPPAGGVAAEGITAAASSYHNGSSSYSICFCVIAPKNQGACSRYS